MKSLIRLLITSFLLSLAMIYSVNAAEVTKQLGRVFLSPAERVALDKERAAHYAPATPEPVEPIVVIEEPEPSEISSAELPPDPTLLVNGYVKRANTSGTVWVNGESSYDGDLAGSKIDHSQTRIIGRSVKLAPLDDGPAVYLKPGQLFVPAENTVSDSYNLMNATQANDGAR